MSESIKKTRKAYEGIAERYDQVNESIEPIMDDVKAFLNLLDGDIILDVGCGHGRDSLYFSKKGLTTIGLDLSPELIRISKSNSKDTCFMLADMRSPPIKNNSMDGLWISASFHHLEKKDAPEAIDQLYQTMKTGGVLYMAVKKGEFTGYENGNRYDGEPRFYSYYSDDASIELLEQTRLNVCQHTSHTQDKLDRKWISIIAKKE